MKKLLILFTLIFTIVAVCPVFASDVTKITNSNNTGDIEVIYTVEDSYMITIPDQFQLSKDEEVSVEISATDVCIEYGTTLEVVITGANCVEGDTAWYIADEKNRENKYEYTIGSESGLDDITDGFAVIIVDAGNTEGETQELFFNLKEPVTTSGTYSDLLTFTAEVVK